MKKIRRRLLAFILISILIVGGSACEEHSNTTSENEKGNESVVEKNETTTSPVVLNVWHQWSNDVNELKKIFDEAVEEYEKDHPNIKIQSHYLDTEVYKTKIAAEFAGTASDIDVFYYWGSGMARKLVNANKLLPLDDYLTEEVKDRMLPGASTAFEFSGHTYSVPMFSWYMAMFCNQELFDQVGATIPTTYDELVSAVDKLLTLEDVIPIVTGANDAWNAAFIYQAFALREVGADSINPMLHGEIPFKDSGYQRAAQKVIDLYQMGAFGKNPLEIGSDGANAIFLEKKAAIRIMGSWFANQVYTDPTSNINPDTIVACKLPMTDGKGKETDYAGGFIESFWVNNKTRYPKEAAQFCIYLNEAIGKAAHETGSGFCGWDIPLDESKLNPLFLQIKQFLQESEESVLAWDTAMESDKAQLHNEQVQMLFAPNASAKEFMKVHEQALNP